VLTSGRTRELLARIQGRRVVNGITILLLEPKDQSGRQLVIGVNRKRRIVWRRSSWVRASRGRKGFNDQYVGLKSSKGTIEVFTASCHRISLRVTDGKVLGVEFTK
jgi:hypothetical protein